jgi:hemimethylated DNA binding protein
LKALEEMQLLCPNNLLLLVLAGCLEVVVAPAASHSCSGGRCASSSGKSSHDGKKLFKLPLFSANAPIKQLADKAGHFQLKFFESRYLKMARLASSSKSHRFGFVHGDMTEKGGVGHVVKILSLRWVDIDGKDVEPIAARLCFVECARSKPFRITRSWKADDEYGLYFGDLEVLNENKPKFQIGQMIQHKKYDYKGVIIHADSTNLAEPKWALGYYDTFDNPLLDQPFYYVIPDARDRDGGGTTYVEEANLMEINPKTDDFQHPLRGRMLGDYEQNTGTYEVRKQ